MTRWRADLLRHRERRQPILIGHCGRGRGERQDAIADRVVRDFQDEGRIDATGERDDHLIEGGEDRAEMIEF